MKIPREQFEPLLLEQLDTLYRLARRLTRDPSRADDLTQETYLRAIRSADAFDLQEYGIRPWLIRIMHNLWTSRAQREKKQPQTVDTEQLDASARDRGGRDVTALPIDPASFESMDQNLVRALDGLPPEYQSVMMLWAVDDLSYKEIADSLEVPIGTVMSRLHRARQRLSRDLHDFASSEGIIRK